MPKARTLHPHQKDHATKGSKTYGPGDIIPDGFKAFLFIATHGSATLSKCNGIAYDGTPLTDPCNIVNKDIGNVPHYVPGEINDIEISDGLITFYLLEELK